MNYNNYPKSMSNFGITAVEAVGLTIPDNLSNDPVTKAVYDNILGNIPPKKKDQFSCSLCKLEFSSKTILNAHLSGSKHQKKLKAQEIMKSLARTDPTCGKDPSSGQLRCNICNVSFMAPHCLLKHSLTREHRIKKGEDVGNEVDMPVEMNGVPTAVDPATGVPIKKKERPRISVSVPDCVTKIEDNRAGGKFYCNPCQASCNSDIQLQQHLSCKKHLEKVSGRKTTTSVVPRWKGGAFSKGRGKSRIGSASSRYETSPLSNSSALLINTITSNYNQAAYPDTSLSSYTDSYGLSSLGRSSVADYSVGKSVSGVRGGNRGATTAAYGQSEMYGVTEGDYGRGTPFYGKPEAYPRSAEYSTDYHHGKASDYSYSPYTGSSAAAAAYAAHGYSTGQSVAPRPAARSTSLYTYTQPLAQNFVSGGKIY